MTRSQNFKPGDLIKVYDRPWYQRETVEDRKSDRLLAIGMVTQGSYLLDNEYWVKMVIIKKFFAYLDQNLPFGADYCCGYEEDK